MPKFDVSAMILDNSKAEKLMNCVCKLDKSDAFLRQCLKLGNHYTTVREMILVNN